MKERLKKLFGKHGTAKILAVLAVVIWVLLRSCAGTEPQDGEPDYVRPAAQDRFYVKDSGANIFTYVLNFINETRTYASGQNIPVCQPRHYDVASNETVNPGAKAEARYKLLTKELLYQVDRVQGGTIAMAVKRRLEERKYPVVVLPYMTEKTAALRKVNDIMVLRMAYLFQQKCGGAAVNKAAGFRTVHRLTLHESRFDWD